MKKGIKKRKDMDIHDVLRDVSENIEKSANVKTVFGDPVRVGHHTIIPVATVSVMGGGGGGFAKEGKSGKEKMPGGVGGGMGLRVDSKPVGYIEIKDDDVHFVPTPDVTGMAFRGILNGMVAVLMFGLAAIIRAFKRNK